MSSDRAAIARLAHAYAVAVDRRDEAGLREVFAPQGTLVVQHGAKPERWYRGHAELAAVLDAVAGFDYTHHEVGTQVIRVDGDRATGDITCVAHHVRRRTGGDAEDVALHVRYHDEYVRGADGRWRIRSRRLVVEAVERRRVRLVEPPAPRVDERPES